MSNKKNQEVKPVDAAGSSAQLGKKRRMKIGVLSLISTIVVIAAVIAVNYFVDYIADRYVLEIDMTKESEYEISDETVQLLDTLSEPITITVLCDETDYSNDNDLRRLPKVLQRYEQLSHGNVTVKYINAVNNPAIFSQYDQLGDLSSGDIIVESAKRYKSMSPYDLLEYQSSKSSSSSSSGSDTKYLTGLRAEQRLTSAILYVTANKVPKAAYISGHQENADHETLDTLLTSANYDVTTLSLMQEGKVPDDVDMIIIAQPKGDFNTEEIDALEEFMDNGGRMIVTFASNTPKLTNLEEYFEEWGVAYEDQMVYDNERCFAGTNFYLMPNVNTVEGLTDNLDSKSYVIIPGARPITTLWDQDNWRGTKALMTTSNNSYAKDLSSETTSYEQSDGDVTGPFNVGVLSYQNSMHNLDSTYSYALFLNAGFLSDSTLDNSAFLNKDYVLAALESRGDLRQLEVVSQKERIDAWVLELAVEDRNVIEVLEEGLKAGLIQIPGAVSGAPDGFTDVNNVTGYLNTFGVTVADRIRNQFMPLFDPASEPLSDEVLSINDFITQRAGYSLYDAQLAVAEAVKRQLDRKKTALIIAECGSGKTKIGSTALGALHGLWAAQRGRGAEKSFGIVMCPSHVTRKWVREIGETLPDTYAMVVHSITDLDRLYALYEQGDKSVYAVFSKERARDGYMRYPAVRWNERRRAFLCPDCDAVIEMEISEDGAHYTVPADQFFFQKEHRKNHVCPQCGSPLWSAVNPDRQIEWVKIGEYGWVHR